MTHQLDSKHHHHHRPHPSTRPRWRGTGLLTLGLLTLGACDPAADPELELEDAAALDDPTAPTFELDADARDLPVLVLGDSSAAVDALADAAELVFASELDGVVDSEVLGASRALAVDLSQASEDQLDGWKPIFDAAWSQRVPIIFTDVSETAAMAKAIGFGLAGEVVVAESLAPTPGFRLHQLGEPPELVTAEELATEGTVSAGPSADGREILALVDALTELPEIAADGSYPTGSYALFEVAPSGHTTSIIGSNNAVLQTVSRNVGFRVELFSDASAGRKYMVVSGEGSGVNAGTMYYNTEIDRGWYQEQVEIDVLPLHDALAAAAHAPHSVNGSHTFNTTTRSMKSLTVSAGVPTLNFTVGTGTSQSATMSEFTVIDEAALNRTNWRFRMNSTSAGPYSDWPDLIIEEDNKSDRLAPIPLLARSTIVPQFESVYWTDDEFEGISKVSLDYDVTYECVWDRGAQRTGFTNGHPRDIAVDFGEIHLPYAGTLPTDERWSPGAIPDRWLIVNEGSNGDPIWYVADYNWIRIQGNSWGVGPDGFMRGTYVRALGSYFGEGSMVARIWPHWAGSSGFMYGIQDAANYYRAVIDHSSGSARIEKFVNNVGELLAEIPYSPQLNTWNLVEVERSGSAHHLYVDGVKLLTVYDNTFATGSVGLYAANVQTAYFGRVRVLRTSEPDQNLAFGRPTTQSSTVFSGVPSRAVDGGTHGDWLEGSVTHTGNAAQAWWRVDLGSMRTVNEVTVWNRTDCCAERLANYDVELLDESLAVVASRSHSGVSPKRRDFDFDGATGRYVRVRLQGTNYLSLAEVEVWGPAL